MRSQFHPSQKKEWMVWDQWCQCLSMSKLLPAAQAHVGNPKMACWTWRFYYKCASYRWWSMWEKENNGLHKWSWDGRTNTSMPVAKWLLLVLLVWYGAIVSRLDIFHIIETYSDWMIFFFFWKISWSYCEIRTHDIFSFKFKHSPTHWVNESLVTGRLRLAPPYGSLYFNL